MAKRLTSIFTDDMETCFMTGTTYWIERHHVFGGANKARSEEYGFIMPVTHNLHNEPPKGIHYNKALRRMLKQYCQRKYEETKSRQMFIFEFGENFIDDEENDGYELDFARFGIYQIEEAC